MRRAELIFVKLGGSLITDKSAVEAVQAETLRRVAREIAAARRERPDMRVVLSHGSGSFGHTAAAAYATHEGVHSAEGWLGFCRVSDAAARLNRLVCAALLGAEIPVVSLQPSASALCRSGVLSQLALEPVAAALQAGIVPLVYGDVAFDVRQGGTIISTETILSYLAERLRPAWLLLAGNTEGVFDAAGKLIPHVTLANFDEVSKALGGSAGTDVTGGMRSKVHDMLALVEKHPGLSVRVLSGLEEGRLREALLQPEGDAGTLITAL